VHQALKKYRPEKTLAKTKKSKQNDDDIQSSRNLGAEKLKKISRQYRELAQNATEIHSR